MDIIDVLGGIDVDIKENEISEINKFIPSGYNWQGNKDDIEYIKKAGVQKINVYQALSYSRIRKGTSGGALEIDRRQREIIEGTIDGVKNLPVSKYTKLLNTILPYIKTNMKPNVIMGVGRQVLEMGNFGITQLGLHIGAGVNSKQSRIDGKLVIEFEPSSIEILNDFIFKNIFPGE